MLTHVSKKAAEFVDIPTITGYVTDELRVG